MPINNNKRVQVCSKCLTAACWYVEFMCDEASSAGTVVKTVGELKALNREHSDYWTNKKFAEVYGTEHPEFD